jgi:hypothetical protein
MAVLKTNLDFSAKLIGDKGALAPAGGRAKFDHGRRQAAAPSPLGQNLQQKISRSPFSLAKEHLPFRAEQCAPLFAEEAHGPPAESEYLYWKSTVKFNRAYGK